MDSTFRGMKLMTVRVPNLIFIVRYYRVWDSADGTTINIKQKFIDLENEDPEEVFNKAVQYMKEHQYCMVNGKSVKIELIKFELNPYQFVINQQNVFTGELIKSESVEDPEL